MKKMHSMSTKLGCGMESGRRKRRSREEWRALLERFEVSGLSLAAFCQAEAVSVTSVHRWRSLLGQVDNQGEATRSSFLDLGSLPPADSKPARFELTLDLGSGLVLHLVRG